MTDDQITALDANVVKGFESTLTAATQAQEAAELARRAQEDQYSGTIAPALDAWGVEKSQKDAEIAFYRTQAESAKASGFIPKDAPGYVAPQPGQRSVNGQFVANGNPVPGSPSGIGADQMFKGISEAMWLSTEHQRLHGSPFPDDFESIVRESANNHQSLRDYATKKYGFEAKRTEIAAAKQKEHDDKIRQETTDALNKEYAERYGSNPNVRTPIQSDFSTLKKAQNAGTVKDPLTMNEGERRAYTRELIHKDISDRQNSPVN